MWRAQYAQCGALRDQVSSLTIAAIMKAVRFDKYGGIDVLRIEEAPIPEPGQGEAQVKVKAASINPNRKSARD